MRTLFIGIILALALVACQSPTSSTQEPAANPSTPPTPPAAPTPGQPTHVSSQVKGVYLAGSSASSGIAQTPQGRSVVSASGAALGGILPTGVPTTLSFLDKDGLTVNASVTRALQLTSNYVLIEYSANQVSTVAVLRMDSGALAKLDVTPDVWTGVYSLGTRAWYEAGGAIVRADLDTGSVVTLSTMASVYHPSMATGSPNEPGGYTQPWDSSSWIYADVYGTAFVVDMTNSSSIRAVAIDINGVVTDLGSDYRFGALGVAACGNTTAGNFLVDPARNLPFWTYATVEYGWDYAHGMSTEIGWRMVVYPVTFSTSGVSFDTSAAPLVQAHIATLVETPDRYYGRIGYGVFSQNSLWTDGRNSVTITFGGGVPAINVWDTSAAPAVFPYINGTRYAGVSNFRMSGGKVFVGPSGSQTLGVMTLGNPSSYSVLTSSVSAIQGWAIVGGVLFWTDSSGNWQAPVSGTGLGAVTPYTGGQVVGVTG